MQEIKLQDKTYLFVEVPFDAHDLGMETECEVSYRISSGEYKRVNTSSLNFSFKVNGIIGFTKHITEEQAKSLIPIYSELHKDLYANYLNNFYIESQFKTAKESLQSLLQANGLDINKNYLILQKL
jgi:hypothetical protein